MSAVPAPQPAPEPTVLVVENDPVVQRILEVLVGSLGFAVDLADSGDEALPLLAYRDYAAVVCDPSFAGDELFRECQARRPEVARRFVFLAGSQAAPEMRRQLGGTGQPCLTAPCRAADLQQAIARVAR